MQGGYMRDTIEHFTKLYQDKQIDRRGFIRGATSLGVGIAAAQSLASKVDAQTAKKGGHFKLGVGSGSSTDVLDPSLANSTSNGLLANGTLYSSLLEYTSAGKLSGDLAESFEASKDAKVWRFKIRKGATFHNGKTITADDVLVNLQYHIGDASKSKVKGLFSSVDSMKVDGDNVQVTLKTGNADFALYMTDYHIGMMATKDGKIENALSGVGSGPYQLEKFEAGVSGKVKRFANHYQQANFDSAEIISIKDVVARTNALTSGEIHAMDRCDIKTMDLLKRNSGITIVNVVGNQHYIMPAFTDTAPFNNKDFRNAIKYGINRQELVDKILYGYGSVGNDHPISPSHADHNGKLEQTKFDPDKAKALLKKSGLDGKFDLSTSEAAFGGATDAAALIQASLAKCGITVNIIKEPDDAYWDKVWMVKPLCLSYWSGRVASVQMFDTAYKSDASWNETHWKNKAFNDLLDSTRAELDPKKRQNNLYELQALIRDDGGAIIPMFANYVSAHSTKIATGKVGGDWDMDGLRAVRRWWFA